MKIPPSILTMLAGITLTALSFWYGQNHGLMPVEASDDAVAIDGLFNTMMIVGTGIFLLVEGILIYSLFNFRRRPGDETDGPPIEGNIPLEILWTALPVIIVLVIGVYSFDVYSEMGGFDPDAAADPGIIQVAMLPDGGTAMTDMTQGTTQEMTHAAMAKPHHHMALGIGASPKEGDHPPDVTVNVTGLQYAWIFNYPETGITSGELHIPVDKDVKLSMKAQDVIHAFWLPEFRLKQDVLPGQESELRFTARRVGDYPIVCAELCGAYHGGMAARLYVQTQEEYDQWVQQQVASQPDTAKTVALATDSLTDSTGTNPRSNTEFLAPIAEHINTQIGLDPSALEALR